MCVVGGLLVWYGVGGAQPPVLSPGDLRGRWHIAQAAAEVPRIQGPLIVFTAASLTEAFKEMGANIEQANPGTKVIFNFAGSPTLRTQLAQGARADVFASADEPNMQGAQQEGTIASEPRLFVRNQLVVIVPAANPAQVMRLHALAKPGVKLVLTHKEVPVGNYSRQALAKMSQDAAFGAEFATRVLANLVSEETNVKQVVAKVQLGEADAGIVYASDVTPAVRGAMQVLAIPEPFNVIANYPIAVVREAPNAAVPPNRPRSTAVVVRCPHRCEIRLHQQRRVEQDCVHPPAPHCRPMRQRTLS
jgi:molybdate transport system substrate-binding protein